jgi:malonyl-CoA/methylmalonyl-CoA synthetase
MTPLFEHLHAVAARQGDRVAVFDDEGMLTYEDLTHRASAIASGLAARGLAGGRIGLLAPPSAEWVVAFAACAAAGVTAVALTDLYAEPELSRLVRASRASALLVADSLQDMATRVAGNVPVLRICELSRHGASLPAGTGSTETPALLLFTSGTTGKPKGVPLTHQSLLHLARTLAVAWRFDRDDVLLHVLPLHHVHGIGVALTVALVSGAAVRFVPRFDAVRVLSALGSATVLMGVPTQHKKLVDAFDAASVEQRAAWASAATRLRLVTSGSAALPPSLGQRVRRMFGQYPLERYGMTEIGIVLANPESGERRPGTVGVPLPGVDLTIVGDDGEPVADGVPGEVWVRAPTVFDGYDADDAATRAAFRNGWFMTGDTAKRGPDGYVTILGRTSVDILKSGGEKISALEIEEALREHPSIADVAVVGVPDETWGDALVAAVVAREGQGDDLAEPLVRAWAKQRLTAYKVPKRFVVVDELPRNALGKVVKGELSRMLTRG